jgi:hypothetical protein
MGSSMQAGHSSAQQFPDNSASKKEGRETQTCGCHDREGTELWID